MWWLTYRRRKLIEVTIIAAASMVHARMLVAVAGLDKGAKFQEGHELDAPREKRVPKECIGRMLSGRQAEAVLRKLEG
jgi:hypothetical protein